MLEYGFDKIQWVKRSVLQGKVSTVTRIFDGFINIWKESSIINFSAVIGVKLRESSAAPLATKR